MLRPESEDGLIELPAVDGKEIEGSEVPWRWSQAPSSTGIGRSDGKVVCAMVWLVEHLAVAIGVGDTIPILDVSISTQIVRKRNDDISRKGDLTIVLNLMAFIISCGAARYLT